jgi:hypothetical protein
MPARNSDFYTPQLRQHKASRQGIVTLNGRDYCLGAWPQQFPKPPLPWTRRWRT